MVDAIAAQAAEPLERRAQVQVQIGDRIVGLNVPADMNAQEAVLLIGYIATQLPGELAKAAGPASRLVLPGQVRRR